MCPSIMFTRVFVYIWVLKLVPVCSRRWETRRNRVWTLCTQANARPFAETLQNQKQFEPTTPDQQKANCRPFLAENRLGLLLPRRKATTEIWDLPRFRCSGSTPERFSSLHEQSHTVCNTTGLVNLNVQVFSCMSHSCICASCKFCVYTNWCVRVRVHVTEPYLDPSALSKCGGWFLFLTIHKFIYTKTSQIFKKKRSFAC